MNGETAVVVVAVLGMILFMAFLAGRAARSGTANSELQEPDEPVPHVRDVVGLLGLTLESTHVATGSVGGANVAITFGSPVTMEIDVPFLPASLSLREEPDAVTRAFKGADVILGDAAFDETIRVEGVIADLLAVLDMETRREVQRELVRHSFVVSGGKVRWTMAAFTTGDELAGIARAGAALASRLAVEPRALPARLARNLRSEPSPAIRIRILQALETGYNGEPETTHAAEHATQDPDIAVRIAAAKIAGGPSATKALKEVALDSGIAPESRAAALAGVFGTLDSGEFQEVLLSFLDSGSSALALAALQTARAVSWRPPIERLLAIAEATHPDARAAAAAALDASDPRAEAKLLGLLENNERPVVLAALESLGNAASVAAVEKLLPLSQARLGSADVRRAAAAAIARIQERNPGASGQLTISEETASTGLVSLAQDRGALSVAPQKKQPS